MNARYRCQPTACQVPRPAWPVGFGKSLGKLVCQLLEGSYSDSQQVMSGEAIISTGEPITGNWRVTMSRFLAITNSLPEQMVSAGMVAFVSDWHHPDGIDADNPRGQPLSMAWCMSVDDARRIAEALNLQEAGKAVEAESLEEVGFLPTEPDSSDRVAALRSRWASSARVINGGKPDTANAPPDPAA